MDTEILSRQNETTTWTDIQDIDLSLPSGLGPDIERLAPSLNEQIKTLSPTERLELLFSEFEGSALVTTSGGRNSPNYCR